MSTRAFRETNREEYLAERRAYYQANRVARDAKSREYVEAHREQVRDYMAQYVQDHREEHNRRNAKWRKANPEASRRHFARWNALRRGAQVMDMPVHLLRQKWNYWAGKCWMCGIAADTWDHVKPLNKGGLHAIVNLRPACRSCNSRKRDRWPLVELAAGS